MAGRTVDRQLVAHRFTVPAGTTAAAPHTEVVDLGSRILDRIDLVVPPGHVGLTGFAVAYAGTVIAPWAGTPPWIIANDDEIEVPIGIEVGAGVQLRGYNTDVHDHSFYVRFVTDTLVAPSAAGRAVPTLAL